MTDVPLFGRMSLARLAAAGTTTPGVPTTQDVDPSTGHGPEWGKGAPIGLLVIVLLVVACYFLARSMSRNMKKVPPSFDDRDARGRPAVPAVSAASAGVDPAVAPASGAAGEAPQAGGGGAVRSNRRAGPTPGA